MRRLAAVATWACAAGAAGPALAHDATDPFPDPFRFEADIAAFAREDEAAPPPAGAVVAVGSSSIVFWRSIARDLAPIPVVPRGFGGSTMSDALYWADRIVPSGAVRAVLLYEGDNDVEMGLTPDAVRGAFDALVSTLRARSPRLRVWVLSIKPSPARRDHWPAAAEANRLLAEACAADEGLHYVDVATAMLDGRGEPIAELFGEDCLHLNEDGYALWTSIVAPILRAGEARGEPRGSVR